MLAGLNRNDDLSELTVGFHVAVCFDNLVEWEDSVDDWLQRAFLQTVDHKIHGRLLPCRIAARGPDVVPFYRQDLCDEVERRNSRGSIALRAVEIKDPLERHRLYKFQ